MAMILLEVIKKVDCMIFFGIRKYRKTVMMVCLGS